MTTGDVHREYESLLRQGEVKAQIRIAIHPWDLPWVLESLP